MVTPNIALENLAISVNLHLRDGRTDGRRGASLRPSVRSSVRSFVSLSVVSAKGVHPMGERTAVLHRNLKWVFF